jgi:formylmethanofuran dehydrogenase subunit B
MTSLSEARICNDVPSPFCGIASDDLKIQVDGVRLSVLENGDAVTTPGFEAPLGDTSPRVGGQPVELEDAVAKAAELLRGAKLPLFSGFGSDVNDTRAALSLLDKCRGVFDQMRAEGGMRNLAVLQDSGWVACTLGELKNRVDVLVSFGTDIEAHFPRFFERFVWTPATLFDQDTKQREVIYIGPAPSGNAATSPDGRAPKVIPCAPEALPDVAAALNALAKGATLQAENIGGVPVAELSALIERLRQARYSVFTWAAGQLNFPHAELAIQQVCQAIVALNKTTRSSALPLGGQDGDRTASQVCAWISSYPTRVGYLRGYPEHDPYHYAGARLLENGEADALVWVNSLSFNLPPAIALPTIVIGRSGMKFDREPDVFIPVGCPGIDHAGHMYRCDNVVAMPLYKLRESGLPSAADVLKAIEAAL